MNYDLLLLVMCIVAIGFLIILFCIALLFFTRIRTLSTPHQAIVTVVIPCYKDFHILIENLPAILKQKYENFNVLLVLDGAEGVDLTVLKHYKQYFDHLDYIFFEKNVGKKRALSYVFRSLHLKNVLLTDADCRPHSEEWISSMVAHYRSGSCVIGYSPYSADNTFLNKWIRYETFQSAFLYLSSAQANIPYMAVARNMMYGIDIYQQVGGFSQHEHIPSGDDDLFIKSLRENHIPVIPCIDKKSFVYSEPKKDWSSYWNQKLRHVTTSVEYAPFAKIILSAIPFFTILFYLGIILMLFNNNLMIALFLLGLRWIIMILLLYIPMRKLSVKDLILYIPLLDIFSVIYYLRLLPGILFKKETW